MPLVEHIRELRSRLIKASLAICVATVLGYVFHNQITDALTDPVCNLRGVQGIGQPTPGCPNGLLYFSGVLSPLTFVLKISLFAGFVLASPIWSYQLWAFVAPGLYKNERRYGLSFVASGVPLFLAGAALCYWIMPKALSVLIGLTPDRFSNGFQGQDYLDFFIRMIVVFGLSFELPVLLVLFNFIGVLSARRMAQSWRGIVFGVFVFAAVATPTGDPLTMLLLALPMCGLFSIALGVVFLNDRRRARRAASDPDSQLSPDEASRPDLTPERIDASEDIT